jgi:cobalt-zinc-cadmium efflux system membrane fusion protein
MYWDYIEIMEKKMLKKIFLYMILNFLIIGFWSCNVEKGSDSPEVREEHLKANHSMEKPIHLSEETEKQIDIKTMEVVSGPVISTLKAMGKVLPPNDKTAIVGYAFPARIVKFHATVGQRVEKGDSLLTLECEEVGNAQTEFVKAIADFELSKLDYAREERLFKKDIRARKNLQEAKTRLEISTAALKAAEKKLKILGLSTKEIKEIYKTRDVSSSVKVNASISGRVTKNNAVLGAMIDSSTEMMVIMDLNLLWIDAEIFEKDLSRVKNGQRVEVHVPAYPAEVFTGQILYIGDVVNPDTRTITVRTRVLNKDSRLKPGMFADIKIEIGNKKEAILVPVQALLDDGNQKIVFVKQTDGYLCRVVQAGTLHNGAIEILKGLKIGEKVVIEGNYQLKSMLNESALSHAH